MPKKKRKITAEDLTRINFVRACAVSPDGERTCLVIETVAEDKKKYHTNLWMVNTDGSDLRQFTYGKRSDGAPVFSPDGRTIAFVSKRADNPGVYLINADGGEACELVTKDGSFSSFSFSLILTSFPSKDGLIFHMGLSHA